MFIGAWRSGGIRPGEKGICPGPHALGLVFVLLTLCGCGATRPDDPLSSWSGVAQAPPITLAQVNTPAALRRDYMRMQQTPEGLPPWLEQTLLIDEALLVSVAPEQTCLLVTLRTEAVYDAPIAATRPVCIMDGREVEGEVEGEEQAATIERWWDGREVGVDPVTMQITVSTEATERMVAITSRVATVCCPGAPHRALELRITHPELGMPPRETYRLKLGWELEAAQPSEDR